MLIICRIRLELRLIWCQSFSQSFSLVGLLEIGQYVRFLLSTLLWEMFQTRMLKIDILIEQGSYEN